MRAYTRPHTHRHKRRNTQTHTQHGKKNPTHNKSQQFLSYIIPLRSGAPKRVNEGLITARGSVMLRVSRFRTTVKLRARRAPEPLTRESAR